MACVCIQELPDEKADNRFSLSQPCPVQNTVIVTLCDCQEDTMSQMEVRRAHRKGRMVPLRPEVWRGRGARSIHMNLGLTYLAWMEMGFMGSGLPPLGDRANLEALPTLAAQGETKS